MNASSITELDEEQRQDAYKKYQLIEPYLNGTLKLSDIAEINRFQFECGLICI